MSFALADPRFDLILRQFDALLADGRSVEEALDALGEAVPEDYRPALAGVGEAVNRARSGIARAPVGLGVLTRAMVTANAAGARPEGTLPVMLRFTAQVREIGRAVRTSFLSRLGYVGVLAVLGLLLGQFFARHVIPMQKQFLGLLQEDSSLFIMNEGVVSRPIWDVGVTLSPYVFGALLVLVGLAAILGTNGATALSRGTPDALSLKILPGFTRLRVAAKRHATLAMCDALIRAGAADQWVFDEVERLSGRAQKRTVEALQVAARTGTLGSELEHQTAASLADLDAEAPLAGSATIIILKVVVVLALAHLIVALYLPIMHQLGVGILL